MTTPPQLKINSSISITQDGRTSVFVSANGTVPQLSFNVTNAGGRAWNVTVAAYPVGYVNVSVVRPYEFDSNTLDCSIWTIPGASSDSTGNMTNGTARVALGLSHVYNAAMIDTNGEPVHTFLYQVLINAMPDGSDAHTKCGGSTHYNTHTYGCDPRTAGPNGVTPDATCTGQACDPTSAACAGGNQEQDTSDNFVFVGITRDAKLSWSIDPATARWCRGDESTALACDTGWTHDWTTQSPYNTARIWGDTSPNATYFEVNLTTSDSRIPISPGQSVPWSMTTTDLRDLGSAACGFRLPIGVNQGSSDNKPIDASKCPFYDPQVAVLAQPGVPGENATVLDVPENSGCAPCSITKNAAGEYMFRSSALQILDPVTHYGLAGDWIANIKLLNQSVANPEASATSLPFHVVAPDFVARLGPGQPGGSAANAYTYPAQQAIPAIRVFGNLTNVGDGAPLKFTNGGSSATTVPVNYLFVIDSAMTNAAHPTVPGSWGAAAPGSDPHAISATFDKLSSDPNADSSYIYVGPGRHTLCFMVDMPDAINESDESTASNVDCMMIYFQDGSKPAITPIDVPGTESRTPRVTDGPYYNDPNSPSHDSFANASIDATRENQTFSINVNASDNDQPNLNVSVIATLADASGATTMTRTYYPCADALSASTTQPNCIHVRGDSSAGYAGNITGFGFATNSLVENWTLTAIATDVFGKNVTASTALQVQRWPIQTIPVGGVVYGICSARHVPGPTGASNCSAFYNDPSRFAFNDNSTEISYHIHVEDTWTGIHDQWNNSGNVQLLVTMPGNKTFTSATWNHTSECQKLPLDVSSSTGQPPTCFDYDNLTSVNLTALRAPQGPGAPGQWNVTLLVRDASHRTRTVNQSFFLYDQPPLVVNGSVDETTVPAGTPIHARVNVSDDFGIRQTFANFTRVNDGLSLSIPLVNFTNTSNIGENVSFVYDDTITTGHGHTLGVAGTFNVTFAALDVFGNWAENDSVTRLTIEDSIAPVLSNVHASATFVETNENVTFRAHVSAASNTTVVLQVLSRGNEFLRANMTEDNTSIGNYSLSTNFTIEGAYTFNMWAIDSVGLQSAQVSRLLFVESNLPPVIDVWTPVLIGDEHFANATPVLRAFAHDMSNVSTSSVELSIDGASVPVGSISAAGVDGQAGVLFTYVFPTPLADGQNVEVNMSVQDLSPEGLVGHLEFNFTVDAVRPTVALPSFQPSYLDGAKVFVSPETYFALTASDHGRVDTGVSFIQYRLCQLACVAGAAGGVIETYTGPFSISDTPLAYGGTYSGPGIYELDLFATDGVGNRNSSAPIFVHVDDAGPTFSPFGSLLDGRYVSATFDDPDSGVDHAVVWWSLNGAAPQSMPLDYSGGLWHALLPGGSKGDHIEYYLEAWDHVGNARVSRDVGDKDWTFTVGSHVPAIKITTPASGSKVSRQVQLNWETSDGDHDALVFVVSYEAVGTGKHVQLARLTDKDARTYAWDVTSLSAGVYEVQVTASDGSAENSSNVTIQVLGAQAIIATPAALPGSVALGDPVLITAQITKPNATIAAEVFRDGVSAGLFPMNDAGLNGDKVANDGIYSARVTFETTGEYTVTIHASYQENGHAKTADLADAGSFSVRVTTASVLSDYTTPILSIGVLVVVGLSIAAWRLKQRIRRKTDNALTPETVPKN